VSSPRDFLRLTEFSQERASAKYPHARRLTLGGLFISHSGADSRRIRDNIVIPVVSQRFPADGYFMHSRGSGGSEGYRELVQAALHWCDKFMVVISKESIANEWVQAEVEWALEQSRPILAVQLGRWEWTDLLDELTLSSPLNTKSGAVSCIDFTGPLEPAQYKLAKALDDLLAKLPRKAAVFDNIPTNLRD